MKYIMWLICHALYGLGDAMSIINDKVKIIGDREWSYHVYSKLMQWSLFINDKYGFDLWKTPVPWESND